MRTYRAAVFTAQSWMLLSKIDCDDALLPIDHWTAVERTHYMESSKLFVPVDRPFWRDEAVADDGTPTGRDTMSMTLTDRMTRGTYLLENGPDRPAVMCLSYTWCDDSLKWLPLKPNERLEVMLKSLREIYPRVDIRKHVIGDPVTVSWENEPYFMGAFKANLPATTATSGACSPTSCRTGCPRGDAGCSSRATTCRGRRAGPRAPCRPR